MASAADKKFASQTPGQHACWGRLIRKICQRSVRSSLRFTYSPEDIMRTGPRSSAAGRHAKLDVAIVFGTKEYAKNRHQTRVVFNPQD